MVTILSLVFMLEGTIPAQWDSNVEALCPNLDSGEKFHTHALNGSGHVTLLIGLPLGTLIGQKWFGVSFEENNRKNRTWLRIFVALALILLTDELIGSVLPKMIFGTKHLGYVKDLLYKKMPFAFALGLLSNGFLSPILRGLPGKEPKEIAEEAI